MGIFDDSVFKTFDVHKLRMASDSEMILEGITLGESDGSPYFQLDFVGAYSTKWTSSPRFYPSKTQESKTGRLLLSLEDNLGLPAIPASLEELIGHRLNVRRDKIKGMNPNDAEKETEYFEILDDLGPESVDTLVNDQSDSEGLITYGEVSDLIHGLTREEAETVLGENEHVQANDAIRRDLESGDIFDVLMDNGFLALSGDLFQKVD